MQDTIDVIVHIRDHTIHSYTIPFLPFCHIVSLIVPSSLTSWFPPEHKHLEILSVEKQAFYWSIIEEIQPTIPSLKLFPGSPQSWSPALPVGSPTSNLPIPPNWLLSNFQPYHFTETSFIKSPNDVIYNSNGIQSVAM